jgi:hypothetical protein
MSIVVCVRVYDGIVLGAESMTQLFGQVSGQQQFIKAYSNARKLYQIGKLPVGILTYGAGNVGQRSIESFVDEFGEVGGHESLTIEELATKFRDFFNHYYQDQFAQMEPGQQPQIGFYVAGYSPNERIGADREFIFPIGQVARPRVTEFGGSWRGISMPLTRLLVGIDPRLMGIMQAQGISQDVIQQVQQQVIANLGTPIAFDGMPVKDAIGYCRFMLETTIAIATYEIGVPTCGGPLQIAVITKSDGFRWVSRPDFI